MNESAQSVEIVQAPLTAPQGNARAHSAGSALVRLSQIFPTVLVLIALGGLIYFGHYTGWALPKFSLLAGAEHEDKDDWCNEHGVPESRCVECQPGLLPKGKEFGWCKKHGVAECVFEHAELAQLQEKPAISPADLNAAARSLAFAERPQNNPKCKLHLRRIQFATKDAFVKAGIEVEPVWRAPMVEAVSANGEITYDSTRVVRLSSRVPGTVWQASKSVGDTVYEGEVLALVDAAEVGRAKAEFLQAFAHFNLRSKTWESFQTGWAQGAVPEAKYREAETALSEARIRRLSAEQALINLGLPVPADDLSGVSEGQLALKLRFLGIPDVLAARFDPKKMTANLLPVKASLDGVIVTRDVVAGEVVDTNKVLFVVADVSRMWLTLSVRVEDSKKLALGQPVRFHTDALREEVRGSLRWISTTVDEKTRTLKIRADLLTPEGRLPAHSFGTGQVVLREEKNAVVVPNEAVHWEGCCHVVFARDKSFLQPSAPKVFHTRKVRIGAKDDRYTEIIAGVLPGEVVATKGSGVLRAELLKNNLGEG
jgi:cobalt-zinc-cadmium efflux system membrane fusion protein